MKEFAYGFEFNDMVTFILSTKCWATCIRLCTKAGLMVLLLIACAAME